MLEDLGKKGVSNPMRITINLGDPWELGESLNWQTLHGELLLTIKGEHGGRGLIKLDNSIDYKGSSWRYIVASPRYYGNDIIELHCGTITANFIGITEQQAHQLDPYVALDTSKWRGGLAFDGELAPTDQPSAMRKS